jgi:hypothetical protein
MVAAGWGVGVGWGGRGVTVGTSVGLGLGVVDGNAEGLDSIAVVAAAVGSSAGAVDEAEIWVGSGCSRPQLMTVTRATIVAKILSTSLIICLVCPFCGCENAAHYGAPRSLVFRLFG